MSSRTIEYLTYAFYILKHKWYVFLECKKVGLWWRGIKHDWHKFMPSEFIPYADYFYGPYGCKFKAESQEDFEPRTVTKSKFNFAWLLHQKRADHHWQWWLLINDEDPPAPLPMSPKARLEMLCDWCGMSKTLKTSGIKDWYEKNKNKIILHYDTREWIERNI